MDTRLLEDIGLTKSEVSVYLALLDLGSSSTGKIVDKSQASSSKIYEILDRLLQKGLVSFVVKEGVKHFEAATPDRILDYVEEREKEMQAQKESLKQIIPELKLKQTLAKHKSEATIYKGLKGIQTAFYAALNLMKSGDEYVVMGIPPRSEDVNRFFIKFEKERARRKVHRRAIFTEAARGDPQAQPENTFYSEVKYTPEINPTAINIFKDRVLIFPETQDVFLISIDSKEVAESLRLQFEMWWKQDIRVSMGFEAFEGALKTLLDDVGTEGLMAMGATFGTSGTDIGYAEFFKKFHLTQRIPRKVPMRILFKQGTEEIIKNYPASYANPINLNYKMLPYTSSSPVETFIGKTKSVLVIQEPEPKVITIDNERIAQDFKTTFESLWKQDTLVETGFPALERALGKLLDEVGGEGYKVFGAAFGLSGTDKKWSEFFNTFHTQTRIPRKVPLKILFQERTSEVVNSSPAAYTTLAQSKFLPYKSYSPVATFIGKKHSFLLIQEPEPTVITLNNERVTQAFKANFESMWNQDVRILRGLDAA
ncbi:MAG: helix-turn-helix domain-containing protein, partial [Nanoarchaeota archaeon]|nr:helix-turn-helix domain-containing protein [Nanoarchaeota archaeon]